MAEFVEKRIEETIPEIEELERIGILTSKEVKKLIQKRRDLQYRLIRCSKKKSDFIENIKYEQNLIELIRIRRKQMGIQEKKQQIEAKIGRRVLKLARFLTRAWPYHNDTWDIRINFASFIGWKEEIATAFMEQVGYQGSRESVWISWAKWEVEERKNFDRARTILLSKATLYHPKSLLIKRELFRLELLYVEHLKMKVKNDNIAGLEEIIAENREKVLNCAVAEAVYKDAVTTIPQPELYLQLYQVAHKFSFAKKLRDQIYRDLVMKFPNVECVWKLRAQRLAYGIHVSSDIKPNLMDVKEESEEECEDEDIKKPPRTKSLSRLLDTKDEDEESNSSDESESDEYERQDESRNQKTNASRNLQVLTNEISEIKVQKDEDISEEESDDEDDKKCIKAEELHETIKIKIEDEDSENIIIQNLGSDFVIKSGRGEISENTTKVAEINDEDGEKITVKEMKVQDIEIQEVVPKRPINWAPREKLKLIISTFDAAIVAMGSKFACTYVEELLPLLYQCWGVTDMAEMVMKTLIHICNQYTTILTPRHFYIWFLVLKEQSASKKKLRVVLNKGLCRHPDVMALQLARIKFILNSVPSDEALLKEFDKVGHSLSERCGLDAWLEVIGNLKDEGLKTRVLEEAANHNDPVVALGTRTLYLKHIAIHKGIKRAREVYKKMNCVPPLNGKIHAQMVELELSECDVNAAVVRKVFHNSVQQLGSTSPGMWLAYIYFEKKRGDALNCGGLYTRAEKELKAIHAHVFRQLDRYIQDILNKETTVQDYSLQQIDDGSILIDALTDEHEEESESVIGSGLVELFSEEPILTYTANTARTALFNAIAAFNIQMNKEKKKAIKKDDGSEWEGVLEKLVGQKVQLSFIAFPTKDNTRREHEESNKSQKPTKANMVAPRFTKRGEPTSNLDPGTSTGTRTGIQSLVKEDDEVTKALQSSAILQPQFLQQTTLPPLFVNKKKAKAKRREEAKKTKGAGWFNMKAPEMTEEVKRDLEVLKMRSVLDPRRHFKASDMKVTPKYFHLGTVVDSPVDFYSSRIPKKQRKRTMAEEIMHDEEALRYQKRKYTQIVANKQKRMPHSKKGKGNKKSKMQ